MCVFTWTDEGGWWTHPEHGSRYPLTDFYDIEVDEDGEPRDDAKVHTEVADRVTYDDPFSHENFGVDRGRR